MRVFSIIVPVYNNSTYLTECCLSILNQAEPNWECLLIDDGSTDGSGDICDSWSLKDSRFSVIHTKNKGVSNARNIGINNTHGDFLIFLDSDDCIDKHFLSSCQPHDLVIGDYELFGTANELVSQKWENQHSPSYNFVNGNLRACMGSYVVKRSLIDNNKLRFDTNLSYGEDMNFTLKVLLHTNDVAVLPQRAFMYRQHETSAIHRASLRMYDVYKNYLEIVSLAKTLNVQDTYLFLREYLCGMSLYQVTAFLIRSGISYQKIMQSLYHLPNSQDFLKNTLDSNFCKKNIKNNILLLLNYPFLLFVKIKIEKNIYIIREKLGRIKNIIIKVLKR